MHVKTGRRIRALGPVLLCLLLTCSWGLANALPDLPRERREVHITATGFVWYAKYDIEFSDEALRIYSNIYLTPIGGATQEEIDGLKPLFEAGIETRWSNQYHILHDNQYLYDILFDVTFVDTYNPTTDHFSVNVRPGPERSTMNLWDTEDYLQDGRVAAHEYGHMIGNYDEYAGGALDPSNPIIDTSSLMGGTDADVVTYGRHYETLISWLSDDYPQEPLGLLATTGLGDLGIDIRPDFEINSVNPDSAGMLPVTIYGQDILDVSDIDLGQLYLAGGEAVLDPQTGLMGSFEDLNGDSVIDVTVQFRMSDLDISSGAGEAVLIGYLEGNVPFAGRDSVVLVGPGDVNGDGFVGASDLVGVLVNWGHGGKTLPEGDLTGEGYVGADDYVEVLTYWGSSGPAIPVPEPATLGLLVACVTILVSKHLRVGRVRGQSV